MNKNVKMNIVLSLILLVCVCGTVTTVTVLSKNNKAKLNNTDKELAKEFAKAGVSDPYGSDKENAPIVNDEIVVEDSAMKEIENINKEEKKEEVKKDSKVIEETKKTEFMQPLKSGTFKIADKFDEKYEGFNQVYIETLVFKPVFNKGNPGIVYKVDEDNTSVYAMESGKVKKVSDNTAKNCGYSIILEHENSLNTEYYCLKKVDVKEGEKITRGQKIAEIGDIGNSLIRNELRIYVLEFDKVINPEKYFK